MLCYLVASCQPLNVVYFIGLCIRDFLVLNYLNILYTHAVGVPFVRQKKSLAIKLCCEKGGFFTAHAVKGKKM